MTVLLDTHAFLWSLLDTEKLSASTRSTISDRGNDVVVSAVTFWEIAIKVRLGRLTLAGASPTSLMKEAERAGYIVAPLTAATAASSHQLPLGNHRDPFDRLLVWQAIQNKWLLVSRDRAMAEYEPSGLKLIW